MKIIYMIKCKCNNKVYIGQTKCNRYTIRMREHKNNLKSNRHSNKYLQEDYNKYGIQNFIFDVIETVPDCDGNQREDYWMEYYGGIDTTTIYNAMNSKTKSIFTKTKLHNYYVGKSHCEIHGKEKAEQMRKANSEKHKGKKPSYIPYKGKVKTYDNKMIVVTEDIYNFIIDLKSKGFSLKEISTITNIKYSGILNITNKKMYLPFKCND